MDKNSTLTERTGSLLATRIVVRDKDGYGDTLPKFGTLRRLTLINYTIVYLVQLGRDREVFALKNTPCSSQLIYVLAMVMRYQLFY